MNLDRTVAPAAKPIEQIQILQPEQFKLDNGIEVYALNAGSQEIVKVDIQIKAGAWYQEQNLVAIHTNSFLKLGSKNYTSAQIAEIFDSKGAYLQLTTDQHFSVITLLCLSRYFGELMEVVEDLIKYPTFPEKEVNSMIRKKRQSFIHENEKVKVKAQKRFTQVLFGEQFPYANTNKLSDYELISAETFATFHRKYYHSNRCNIIIAGKLESNHFALLNLRFGGNDWLGSVIDEPKFSLMKNREVTKDFIEKKDALQSALRVGKLLPNRNSEDYYGLTLLLTVFGGYFGSRLMSNIREDKGYTYGIGCGYITLPNAAYMNITSEVGVNVIQPALGEIYKEIERLQTERIPETELQMVKNYLQGELLRSFDGIFAMSHSLKTLLDFDLDYDHYQNYFKVLQGIETEQLQHLAQKYLSVDSMVEVVAGKY